MQPGSARFAIPAPDTAEEGKEASPEGGEGSGECCRCHVLVGKRENNRPAYAGRQGCQQCGAGAV